MLSFYLRSSCSARVFLGLAEGGLFPGVTYYISLWYPRQMQAKRVAIFFSAATVAGAFGGILAYGIEHLEGCVTMFRSHRHPLILIFTERPVSMAGSG
jgi:MFS family permease